MEKRYLIIAAIAVALIAIGGYLIFTNSSGSEVVEDSLGIVLKTQDFELFEIDVPKGSNFSVKNEAQGMKYFQNTGKYSGNISGIIISKNLTDTLIGDNSELISNSTSEQIYSFVLKNETNYKYVSNQKQADIILIGTDLNLLKEISDTIKIEDVSELG